ncbi:hypothetical protein IWQ51_002416 [Labrenzia sp. EL_142]|nr:hypothetical protein [Labrenzia sp. EL_142]
MSLSTVRIFFASSIIYYNWLLETPEFRMAGFTSKLNRVCRQKLRLLVTLFLDRMIWLLIYISPVDSMVESVSFPSLLRFRCLKAWRAVWAKQPRLNLFAAYYL